jgi:hypothetical protein
MNLLKRILGEPTPKRPVKVKTVEELNAETEKALAAAEKANKEAEATQALFDANAKLAEANEALRLAKRGEYSK